MARGPKPLPITLTDGERAVLLARVGDRDAAVAQLGDVVPNTAALWYERAAVFALGSTTHFDDVQEAYKSLWQAYRSGFADTAGLLADADFENVIDRPDFRRLIERKPRLDE